jgi:glycosyltransferase involved in cell wall biosynthesis
MMKILHVINSLNVGGAEKLVVGLSAISKRAGDHVEVYVLGSGGLLEADACKAGVPVHLSGSGSAYSPIHVLRLVRFIRSRRFDTIHAHLYPAQLWICLASRLAGSGTPIVTTEHCASNRRRTPLYRWLDRWMYRQFAAIAAISVASRDALRAHIGGNTPPILVVPNGIDLTPFEFRSPCRMESSTPTLAILCIGSLTRVKDQATVVRAIAQLDCFRLILVGDGPLRGELETMALRLGVGSRVVFLGTRRDIPQLIASADLYVQTSIVEGFCLAVVEAMCGGLPCIVSDNAGLRETVGQAGMYFEPGNADDLASSIRALANDPVRRTEMTRQGLDRARMFTLEACHTRYDNLYAGAGQPVTRGTETDCQVGPTSPS